LPRQPKVVRQKARRTLHLSNYPADPRERINVEPRWSDGTTPKGLIPVPVDVQPRQGWEVKL